MINDNYEYKYEREAIGLVALLSWFPYHCLSHSAPRNDTMRFLRLALFVAPLAVGVQVDRRGREVYDGYKVFRVVTEGDISEFESQLESLSAIELSRNRGHVDTQHFDIAVPPESLDAFDALNFEAEVLAEDLGADIALEGELQPFPGQQITIRSTLH